MLAIYIIMCMKLLEIFQCYSYIPGIIQSFHWRMAEPNKFPEFIFMASNQGVLKSILQDIAIKNKELVQNVTIVFSKDGLTEIENDPNQIGVHIAFNLNHCVAMVFHNGVFRSHSHVDTKIPVLGSSIDMNQTYGAACHNYHNKIQESADIHVDYSLINIQALSYCPY